MILIFLFSLVGYISFISTKIEKTYAPVVTFSFIGLCVYLGGLLDKLQIIAYLILWCGVFLGIYMVKKRRMKKLSFPYCSLLTLCFITITVIFLVVSLFLKMDHYDNFSHWGIVVKNMLTNHRFPEAYDALITFKDYPLGMSSFIYYFCLFLGNNQGIMIMSQTMFIFSCFYAIFGIIEEKKRFLLYVILSMGCSFMIYLNMTIRIQNLLVDFILPLLTLATCSFIYHKRYDIKKVAYLLIPLLAFMTVMKETGVFFMIISYLYWQWYCWRSSYSLLERLMLSGMVFIAALLPWLLWQYHVYITFGDMTHKFDLLSESLPKSQYSYLMTFFFQSLFHLSNRSTQVFLFFEILFVGLFIFNRWIFSKPWQLQKIWFVTHMVVIIYIVGLLGMYLFSMPQDEAIRLAGMERYVCSIVVFFVGAMTMGIVVDMERSFYIQLKDGNSYKAFYSPQTKKLYQNTTLVFMMITLSCVYSEICELIMIQKALASSIAGQVEQLVGDHWYPQGQFDTSQYLVVASDNQQQVSQYQLNYTMKYFLYAPYVETLSYLHQNVDIESYDYVIIFNQGYVADEVLKQYPHFYTKGIYKIKR